MRKTKDHPSATPGRLRAEPARTRAAQTQPGGQQQIALPGSGPPRECTCGERAGGQDTGEARRTCVRLARGWRSRRSSSLVSSACSTPASARSAPCSTKTKHRDSSTASHRGAVIVVAARGMGLRVCAGGGASDGRAVWCALKPSQLSRKPKDRLCAPMRRATSANLGPPRTTACSQRPPHTVSGAGLLLLWLHSITRSAAKTRGSRT